MPYVYPNLQKLLKDRHISGAMYAAVIGTAASTAVKKIRGEYDHTLEEAYRTMTIFPEYAMDYVFAREPKGEDTAA